MRTTITLDEDILEDLLSFTDAKTRTEAVNRAIADWVRRKRIDALRSKRGRIEWEGDLEQMRNTGVDDVEPNHG